VPHPFAFSLAKGWETSNLIQPYSRGEVMQAKLLLALLPAVYLCWPARSIHAQQSPNAAATSAATGRIVGVLTDPVGARIPGARIELRNRVTGLERSLWTDQEGRFVFDSLPVGRYQITAAWAGFKTAVIHDLSVTAGGEADIEIALKIDRAKTVETIIAIEPPDLGPGAGIPHTVSGAEQARSRNTAEIVAEAPGVSLRENGQFASAPLLHGLGDERAKLVVNGMTVSSACANHMNPPLSYIAPSHAAEVTVMAGITPVSLGGDSLGGTISVESQPPVFAPAGRRLRQEGASTGFYRSNGRDYGGSFTEWVAGHDLGAGYSGSWTTNDDYADGSGHKVTSTYAQSTDHVITLAAQHAGNLAALEASLHHTPYDGFVNAQMDLVRNVAESLNLHYRGDFARTALDAHVFWQNTWHSMNIGKDKSTFPMSMFMPMNTHGRDLGYSVKLEAPLTLRQTLRAGNELHRFVLDDRWPAVAGMAPMMGPDTFVSINDGRRIRLGTYAELASKWNAQWTTLFGARNDTVWTNAGEVQGYCNAPYNGTACPYTADAEAFNVSNRAHTNPDFDVTALLRYEPNAIAAYELGYARKTRAPNLYERYAWSTNMMASGMIGWFGDGNYYVGNVSLKPEIANTVSGTASWRDPARKAWEVKVTPYEATIQSYVDVDTLAATTYGMSTFAQLRFANYNARIYGADLSGSSTLWKSDKYGQGKISGVGGWLHGERLDSQTPLYQMMPVNLRVAFDEELKGLTAGLGAQAVDRKSNVDPHRYEQVTPGYALFNLHASYQRGHLQANAAADNLLNKCYELPLGGVNFDDFMASGWMSQIKPLTGRGRSVSFSLTARF
jgi:iron complex outermembrane receptor protein